MTGRYGFKQQGGHAQARISAIRFARLTERAQRINKRAAALILN
jgi:hypothetical protein